MEIKAINGGKNEILSKQLIACGTNDVCDVWDGLCSPQYH